VSERELKELKVNLDLQFFFYVQQAHNKHPTTQEKLLAGEAQLSY
jgi:hypothetical protein